MTFHESETGISTGQPVRLYLFELHGESLPIRYGYNSSDRDIVYEGVTYLGNKGIKDDGIRQTGQTSADVIKIDASANLDVAAMWRNAAPSAEVSLTIFDLHYPELLARVRWVGNVSSVNWPRMDTCQITCQNIKASLEQTGLRLTWARGCSKTLYQCGVSAASFRVTRNVVAITGTTVEVDSIAGFLEAHFIGGFIEWVTGVGFSERRGIETQTGNVLGLLDLPVGLTIGREISLYPGCNRTIATCDSKFSNLLNYGGSPYMPGSSPFSGNPVF